MVGGVELESLINFENDSLWFMKNYDKLRADFKGKVVAIKDKKIFMDAEDIDKLLEKAEKAKIELSKCVVEFIPQEEIIMII